MPNPITTTSILAIYREARAMADANPRVTEEETLCLDAVMEELIAGDITQGEAHAALTSALDRLKAAQKRDGANV